MIFIDFQHQNSHLSLELLRSIVCKVILGINLGLKFGLLLIKSFVITTRSKVNFLNVSRQVLAPSFLLQNPLLFHPLSQGVEKEECIVPPPARVNVLSHVLLVL